MKNSRNSSGILKDDLVQLPLPGQKVEVETVKPNWRALIETTTQGRVRLHVLKKAVK